MQTARMSHNTGSGTAIATCVAAAHPIGNCGAPPSTLPLLAAAGTLASGAAPYGSLLTSVLRLNNGTSIDSLVTALETKGVLRRLAEPNLMALSGDAARFLAGGEFPVPVASTPVAGAFPTVTIEFKKFGVELAFVPTVLSRGVINLRVEPSVSELDFANAVTIGGTTIPALTRPRRADHGRIARRPELCNRRPAADPQPAGRLAGALDRLGAGARDAVPQFVLPAAGNRSRDHRDAAPGRAGGAGADNWPHRWTPACPQTMSTSSSTARWK